MRARGGGVARPPAAALGQWPRAHPLRQGETHHARGSHRRRRTDTHRPRRQGLAQDRPRGRPRRDPAARADRAQPTSSPDLDRRRDDGLRLRRGRVRLQHRPHRRAAGRDRPPRARVHGQSLLLLIAADRADGLSRDQGRRGRHLHRRRRGGRQSRRAGQPVRVQPRRRRLARLALQRLHPDGHDSRERGRGTWRQPRGPGRMGARLPDPCGRGRRVGALRPGDRPRHRARSQGHR